MDGKKIINCLLPQREGHFILNIEEKRRHCYLHFSVFIMAKSTAVKRLIGKWGKKKTY